MCKLCTRALSVLWELVNTFHLTKKIISSFTIKGLETDESCVLMWVRLNISKASSVGKMPAGETNSYSCSGWCPSLSVRSVQRGRRGDRFRGETSPPSAGTGRVARGNAHSRCHGNTPDSSDSLLMYLCELQEMTESESRRKEVRLKWDGIKIKVEEGVRKK